MNKRDKGLMAWSVFLGFMLGTMFGLVIMAIVLDANGIAL
jgi:hypothetical protein